MDHGILLDSSVPDIIKREMDLSKTLIMRINYEYDVLNSAGDSGGFSNYNREKEIYYYYSELPLTGEVDLKDIKESMEKNSDSIKQWKKKIIIEYEGVIYIKNQKK